MGTFRETLAEGHACALHLGPERHRVYSDLSPKEKERYNADIRATNILVQRLPKDIYTLINHYTDAKDIWVNVKMLLEGLEITKEDRESQLYDDFEHFRQHKGETIHDYYVWFAKLINDMRNIKMTIGLMDSNHDQLYAYLKQHKNRGQGNNARGASATGYRGAQNRGGKDNVVDEDVDEQPVQDLVLNVDNMFQADDCNSFDSDVDKAPTAQTMFMANLSSSYPVYDELVRLMIRTFYLSYHYHNIKEENLKKELHSVKIQLTSTINHNKSMVEEVTSLKKDFKQKENKHLEEFLDMKAFKEKVEDKLYKQDQSLQTVHMLCKPKPYYDEQSKVQSRGNKIRDLREKISRLIKKHSDADPIHDLKALVSQNKELHAKVNALHDLNERW
nr:hypothetical protein [Tanacetum cinerariifolium]